MAESCSNCGAELFAGQQYCRRCGAPTRQFSTAEIPTQILPEGQAGARAAGQTAEQPTQTTPLPARDTADPVYQSRYAGYHPPATLGRERRSRRGWLWALLAVLVVSVGVSVFVARQLAIHWANKTKERVRQAKIVVPKPDAPELPLPVVEPHELSLDEEDVLDEEGADVTSDKTVITKTYPLGGAGSFALNHVAGDISVEGWDRKEAEVRIVKRGGTTEERAAVEILHGRSDDRLEFKTTSEESKSVKDVQYEVRLPRSLRQLEISARQGNVHLSDLRARVAVSVMRGNIHLENVSGTVTTRTTKGHTRISLAETTPREPQVFNGAHGDVELRLPAGLNAELKAETIDGRVEADGDLNLRVERRLAGEQAVGRFGRGGQPIVVKTVSGNIKIKN